MIGYVILKANIVMIDMLKTDDYDRKKVLRRFRSLEMEYKGKKCVVLSQADDFSDTWVIRSEDQAYYIVSGKEILPTNQRMSYSVTGRVSGESIIRGDGAPVDIDFVMSLFEGKKIKLVVLET